MAVQRGIRSNSYKSINVQVVFLQSVFSSQQISKGCSSCSIHIYSFVCLLTIWRRIITTNGIELYLFTIISWHMDYDE